MQCPSSILFVTHHAHPKLASLSLSDGDPCRLFDRWRLLSTSGITVDFQRIFRSNSIHCGLKGFAIDLAAFDEGLIIGRNDRVLTQSDRQRTEFWRL
jgi:hypothetical protein